MDEASNRPEYTGMDKYPGWIATVITIIVGVVFVGALVMEGQHSGDHGGDHGDAHHDEAHGEGHHDEAGHDKDKKEAH